jgi:hypothetical protein
LTGGDALNESSHTDSFIAHSSVVCMTQARQSGIGGPSQKKRWFLLFEICILNFAQNVDENTIATDYTVTSGVFH